MTVKVSNAVLLDLEDLIKLEKKDKIWFDNLLGIKCLKHYSWDKEEFVDCLSSKKNLIKIAREETNSVFQGKPTGYVAAKVDSKEKKLEVLNIAAEDNESFDKLIESVINEAKEVKLDKVKIKIDEDNTNALSYMTKLAKPKLIPSKDHNLDKFEFTVEIK